MTEESSLRVRERADYSNALPADVQEGIKERMRRVDAFSDLFEHVQEYPLPDAERQEEVVEFLSVEHEDALFEWKFYLSRHGVPELPKVEE